MCPEYEQNPTFLDSAHILLKPYIFCASHKPLTDFNGIDFAKYPPLLRVIIYINF
jgi:hypothetical protein